MDNLYQIFGSQPSYIAGLLGEDEAERLRKQAQQSAMMNFGLSLLAASGPSTTQRSTGQLLAQGIMAGQQANRSAYEQAVRDRMMQEQIAEQRRLQEERKFAQSVLPNIIQQGPELYGEDIMGQRVGVGVGAPQLNLATLQQLLTRAPSVAAQVIPTVESYRKLATPEAPKREKLAVEERLVDPVTGQVIATGAPKQREPKYTDIDVGNQIIRYMDGQEIQRIPKGRAPEGPVSYSPLETEGGMMRFNPRTGKAEPITTADGKPVMGKGTKPTEGQLSTAGYAKRMAAAEQILSAPSIATEAPGMGSAIAASVPFIGAGLETIIQSPETQSYRQAAKDWIRAKLRKESGAAIGVQEEAEEYRTYFPQPGDSDLVVEQKRQARIRATQGMVEASGSAFKAPESPRAPGGPRIPVDQMTPQQRTAEQLKAIAELKRRNLM